MSDVMETAEVRAELDAEYSLGRDAVAFYAENGYVKLKDVFSAAVLEHYGREISERVAELSVDALPMAERTTYGKAFLQVMNLWRQSEVVKEFVMGRRLGRIAAELMGVTGVRLYHDQALYKEAGGGLTPWHADQYYWPVATEKTVTAWVPLQATPLEMGPLAFCRKSHRFQIGRDLEISDESELTLKEALAKFETDETAFDLGEVSFHAGWTFHRAGVNTSGRPRAVMTVIYIDEAMRLAAPRNKNQVADAAAWCPGVRVGEIIDSEMNPVVYKGRC